MNRPIDKKLNFIFCSLAALSAILLLSFCGSSTVAGNGSGTGTGNGVIAGRILDNDSLPIAGAIVRLRSQEFLPDTSGELFGAGDGQHTAMTDYAGWFVFNSVDTGIAYSIEVLDTIGSSGTTSQGTMYKVPALTQDTLILETRVVQEMPQLTSVVIDTKLPVGTYVLFYGLERVSRIDQNGSFTIENLPMGDCESDECCYAVRFLIPQPDSSYLVREGDLQIDIAGNGKANGSVEWQ